MRGLGIPRSLSLVLPRQAALRKHPRRAAFEPGLGNFSKFYFAKTDTIDVSLALRKCPRDGFVVDNQIADNDPGQQTRVQIRLLEPLNVTVPNFDR